MTPERSTLSLSIEHICAGYGHRQVLKDLNFQAEAGMLTGLLGANGCGKTTLLKVLCQQLPHSGQCICSGQPLEALPPRELARRISYIPQRSGISISLPVLEVVLMGFNPVLGLLQHPSRAQQTLAYEALAAVGMEQSADTDYLKLSEGQKQLCILARTLVENAPLLLLDEPESSLDFQHRHSIMRRLSALVQGSAMASGTGKIALITLHDPALALQYCERLILLKNRTCTGVIRPLSDDIPQIERALSEIYGPVRLKVWEENGRRHMVPYLPFGSGEPGKSSAGQEFQEAERRMDSHVSNDTDHPA